jgi:hypothetical protein
VQERVSSQASKHDQIIRAAGNKSRNEIIANFLLIIRVLNAEEFIPKRKIQPVMDVLE